MIPELIDSITDRLQADDDTTEMSLMTRDDDGIDWESTPFTPTSELRAKTSESIEQVTKRGASRLYEELTTARDGQLDEVRTNWFDTGDLAGYTPTNLYFYEIGATVATADGVSWNAAFTMDLEEAPSFKSEAWKDMASEFQLTEFEADKGTESMIMCAYNALEKMTKRNGGFRAVHPKELRTKGPRIKDRYFELAMTCLAECDGVNGPTDGPAWSYVDPERTDTEATEPATEETTA